MVLDEPFPVLMFISQQKLFERFAMKDNSAFGVMSNTEIY